VFQTIISASELLHNRDESWVLVDCRFRLADTEYGRRAFSEAHVPGAKYAHLDHDLSGPVIPGISGRHPLPDPATFRDRLGDWGIRPDTQVVAYDDGPGAIASRLWWLLRYHGHTAVAVLNGGFAEWVGAAGPTSSVSRARGGDQQTRGGDRQTRGGDRQTYPGEPDPGMTAKAGELLGGEFILVDARARPRFLGESEPIDPVAGHIPGAVSRPFQDNVGEDGRLKPAEILRRRFEPLGDTRRVVQYCGSGVTAAYNLLAMEVAGLGGGRMYPGSWSEWITDEGRPVETGDNQNRRAAPNPTAQPG
jgi:thiosulfate/3-mercaptopyruvate sulfurtransferase